MLIMDKPLFRPLPRAPIPAERDLVPRLLRRDANRQDMRG